MSKVRILGITLKICFHLLQFFTTQRLICIWFVSVSSSAISRLHNCDETSSDKYLDAVQEKSE